MDFMTTTTPKLTRKLPLPRGRRAFTLVEMMIGATLGGFIMLAVMTCFLFLARSGANIQNYTDMESQARRALEQFAEDVRQASAITWNDQKDITLYVNGKYIRYYYSSTPPSGYTTNRIRNNYLYRIPPSSSAPSIPVNPPISSLAISGISDFNFQAYNVSGANLPVNTAALRAIATSSTKQLQISLEAMRQSSTVATATNTVLSARFILRNKSVTA